MKHCIFQYWLSKPVLPGACASRMAFQAYASMVGADYRFHDDRFMDAHGVDARWFDALRPVFDPTFDDYDTILSVDMDVFPVDGLKASIFEEPLGDLGMCEEPDQPELRERFPTPLFSTAIDQRWARWVADTWGIRVPCDDKGRPRVWNAGVVLFSRVGRLKIRTNVLSPRSYVAAAKKAGMPTHCTTEQTYLNVLAASRGVRFTNLSVEWNRQIHKIGDGSTYDRRTADTKLVHVMLRGADHNSALWHHGVVNHGQG